MTTQGDREASHAAKGDDREANEEINGLDRTNGRAAIEASLSVNSWLHLAEAARRLKWPMERLRSLARRGKVQARRGNDGHLFILITPDLVTKAKRLAEARAEQAARLAGGDHEAIQAFSQEAVWDDREAKVADLQAEADSLKAEVVELRQEAVELQKQAVELRVALAKAEAKVETVETVAQIKEAALRELVGELKAQLAEVRKIEREQRMPWWRKVWPT